MASAFLYIDPSSMSTSGNELKESKENVLSKTDFLKSLEDDYVEKSTVVFDSDSEEENPVVSDTVTPDDAKSIPMNEIRRTIICKFLKKCKHQYCGFAHTPEEFTPNWCRFGKNCSPKDGKQCYCLHPKQDSFKLFEILSKNCIVKYHYKKVIRDEFGLFEASDYRFQPCKMGQDCISKSNCMFYHDKSEQTELSELTYRVSICKFVGPDGKSECKNRDCRFAHSKEELLPSVCQYGKRCKYDLCNRYHKDKTFKEETFKEETFNPIPVNPIDQYRPSEYRPSEYRPSEYRPSEYRPSEYRPSEYQGVI